ncbi:MAG: hypothetical protein AAB370_05025 [Verrucomicrobiota bacterium]
MSEHFWGFFCVALCQRLEGAAGGEQLLDGKRIHNGFTELKNITIEADVVAGFESILSISWSMPQITLAAFDHVTFLEPVPSGV